MIPILNIFEQVLLVDKIHGGLTSVYFVDIPLLDGRPKVERLTVKSREEYNRRIMLTQEEIQQIISAGENVFATKADLAAFQEDMRKNFSSVLTAVDSYAKRADTYFQEMVMLAHKVDRHEKWFQQVANKLGIRLEY